MRFLTRAMERRPDGEALQTRLSAIAARGKLDFSETVLISDAPQRAVARRFWTPAEIPETDSE